MAASMTIMNLTKPTVLALALAAAILPARGQTNSGTATNDEEYTYDRQKLSYAIGEKYGADVSNLLKRIEIEPDWGEVERGFADRLAAVPNLTDDQVHVLLSQFESGLQGRLSKRHRIEGQAFRDQFKAQENIINTDSGLIIKTETTGVGVKPTTNDIITANYRVKLIDGTVVDDSYLRGRPAEFPLNGLKRGWTESLGLMPVGSKWTIVIPPELAYGEQGASPLIGPEETLIFEVELLSCKPAPPTLPEDLQGSDIVVVPSQAEIDKGAQPKVLSTADAKANEITKEKQQLGQPKN